MPKITDLTALTTAANGDLLAIVDTGSASTKKITKQNLLAQIADGSGLNSASIGSSKLNLSKTVDANGWTVYDYGTFKQYSIDSAQSSINITTEDRTAFTPFALPVGFSTMVGLRIISATIQGSSFPGGFILGLATLSNSASFTTINGLVGNNGGTTATGTFRISVTLQTY